MLSAAAVDAMLQEKGCQTNKLYCRINEAQKNNLITKEMAEWAHQVRLDANEQRHADNNSKLPTKEEAQATLDFALALAEFLFVLPSKVKRGLADSGKANKGQTGRSEIVH